MGQFEDYYHSRLNESVPPPLPGQQSLGHPMQQAGQDDRPRRTAMSSDPKVTEAIMYVLWSLKQLKWPECQDSKAIRNPEIAEEIYNNLGRSRGIIERIKSDPKSLDRVLGSWYHVVMNGDMPQISSLPIR